jgi:hypothetical protein
MKVFWGFQGRIVFPIFNWECLHMVAMEMRKNNDGNVVVFMALKYLCRFLLFGMSMLLWILLDVGSMCGKGVAKQRVAHENFAMEQKKDEQQNK